MILYKMNNYIKSLSKRNDLNRRNQQDGKRKEEWNEETILVKVIGLWEMLPVLSINQISCPDPSFPTNWYPSLQTPMTNPLWRRQTERKSCFCTVTFLHSPTWKQGSSRTRVSLQLPRTGSMSPTSQSTYKKWLAFFCFPFWRSTTALSNLPSLPLRLLLVNPRHQNTLPSTHPSFFLQFCNKQPNLFSNPNQIPLHGDYTWRNTRIHTSWSLWCRSAPATLHMSSWISKRSDWWSPVVHRSMWAATQHASTSLLPPVSVCPQARHCCWTDGLSWLQNCQSDSPWSSSSVDPIGTWWLPPLTDFTMYSSAYRSSFVSLPNRDMRQIVKHSSVWTMCNMSTSLLAACAARSGTPYTRKSGFWKVAYQRTQIGKHRLRAIVVKLPRSW